jgi:hypothetical protein
MGKHSSAKCEKVSGPSLFDLRIRLAASQATSMVSRRSTTRRVGAAAGGLLGLAFLPLAIANADEWTITPDPSPTNVETITGVYGHGFEGGDTAPPAVEGSLQGDQTFDYTDTLTTDSGTFYGYESTSNDGLGDINTEVYVASDVTGTGGPSVGSVFDTYTYDDGLFSSVYSAIPNGNGTATVTDTLVTPTGNIAIPTTFDAADGLIADADGASIGTAGDEIIPVGSQATNAISGIPPLTVALQGTQMFDVDNAGGTHLGSFPAVDTTTTDGAGTYTEAVLATGDSTDGSITDGSIFNTINFFGLDSYYSDIVPASGSGADTITETISSDLGSYTIPVTFDAAEAEGISNADLTLPNGLTLDPTDGLTFTGINGLPPVDVGVQGTQDFDYTDGPLAGNFTADVTNTLDEFNDSTETILVTSSSGSDLPAGSEFEIVNFGNGFESIYSDTASTAAGGDTITDTFVTPFGDIPLTPAFDASAGLAELFTSMG